MLNLRHLVLTITTNNTSRTIKSSALNSMISSIGLIDRRKMILSNIRNVITTADLRQKVDAPKFLNFPWGTYDTEYYGGKCGYVKDETMRGRVTIFLSGKMISTGARSVKESEEQLKHVQYLLVRNGFVSKIKIVPKVQNIVALSKIDGRLDLNLMSLALPRSMYEPEQFPALIHKTEQGTTCLIFDSGKIVIVGSKSEQQLIDTELSVIEKLKDFKIK